MLVWCIFFISFNVGYSDAALENTSTTKFKDYSASSQCFKDLRKIMSGVISKESWALKMIDAASKFQSGILDGNNFDYGSYDECMSLNPNTNKHKIGSRYCLVVVEVDRKLFTGYMETMLSPDMMSYSEYTKGGRVVPLVRAICVPQSCDFDDLQFALNLLGGNYSSFFNVNYELSSCRNWDYHSKFETMDWVAIGLLTIFALLLLVGTSYDVYESYWYSKEDTLDGLSLELTSTTTRSDEITCLNGIRVLSILWIAGAHQFIITSNVPMIDPLKLFAWSQTFISAIIFGAPLAVDSFFFLSGFLVMYISQSLFEKGHRFNFIAYYVNRYVRLMPALIVVSLVSSSLYGHLISGPTWAMIEKHYVEPCRNNWWTNLVFVQNFYNLYDVCVIQTWFLAVDTQLYVVAPLFIILIQKLPNLIMALMSVLVLVSCCWGFGIGWSKQFSASLKGQVEHFADFYAFTPVRMNAWFIGAILGYVLFRTRNRKVQLKKVVVLLLWITSLATLFLVTFCMNYFMTYEYNRITASLYHGFAKALWCLGLSWIVFACAHGYGGIIERFLSATAFRPLSKLTYSMYLLHMHIIYMFIGNLRLPLDFSELNMVSQMCGSIVVSMFCAVFWYLMFEAPFIVICKLMFSLAQTKKLIIAEKNNVLKAM